MSTTFVSADAAIGTSRTLLYTCPSGTQAVAFSGTIANIDDTNMATHLITAEVQKTDSSYVSLLNYVMVPYGRSLSFPKLVLQAGEKLYVKAELASTLAARISIVERV